jgi:hypothetical protein
MLDDIPALRTATRQGAQAPSGGVGARIAAPQHIIVLTGGRFGV